MPQAREELHVKMEAMFGDPISDTGPMKFLTDAGYKLRRDWRWAPKEGVLNYKDMTSDEYDCMLFLVEEWDMGGLALDREDDAQKEPGRG